ncbi:MoaD/ThiS family protein [Paenibacillus sp. NRS-1783]|uniref:MoaD/ThiS family protein n=1 Tax=unclassified Paenibacillus TaxID=185978 RepID=UPI003D2E96FC
MNTRMDYQRELERIREHFGYDFMALALVEPTEYQYVIKWKNAAGNLNDRFKRIVLQSGKGIAGIVFKTGKSVFIPSIFQYVGADNLFNYPIVQSGLSNWITDQYPDMPIRSVRIAINEEYALSTDVLQDGDIAAFIPPVSGG